MPLEKLVEPLDYSIIRYSGNLRDVDGNYVKTNSSNAKVNKPDERILLYPWSQLGF